MKDGKVIYVDFSRNERLATLEEIKKNLDRLQQLHHKLHQVLEELHEATNAKANSKKES